MASPIAKYEDATLRKVLAVTLDPMPSDNVPALHLAALAEVCLGRRRRSCLRLARLPGVAVKVPTPSPGCLSHLSEYRASWLALHTPVRTLHPAGLSAARPFLPAGAQGRGQWE